MGRGWYGEGELIKLNYNFLSYLPAFVILIFVYGCSSTSWIAKIPAGQYMAGQIKDSDFDKDRFKDVTEESAHVPSSSSKKKLAKHYYESDISSAMVPGAIKDKGNIGDDKETIPKDGIALRETGQRTQGKYSDSTKFLEFKNEQMISDFKYAGTDAFSFTILKDSFEYTSKNNTYEKVYEDKNDSVIPLGIHLEFDHYFSRGIIDFALGVNVGAGYHRGPGVFSTDQITVPEVQFTLWTLPIEGSITLELAMSNYLKLSISGGPSALGLIQSRSDRNQNEAKKTRRQVGYGYFATGKIKIGLTPWTASSAIQSYSSSEVTGTYLFIAARMVSYSGFQNEDLGIAGSSLGIGFSFESL